MLSDIIKASRISAFSESIHQRMYEAVHLASV